MALKELLKIYAIVYHLGNLQTSFAMSDQKDGYPSHVQVQDKPPISNIEPADVGLSTSNYQTSPNAIQLPSDRPRVAVFDFDDTLARHFYFTDSFEKHNPECFYIKETHGYGTKYGFLPYLRILFEYLFKQRVRIAFFSSEDKERNMGRIPPFLARLFGNRTYESLKSKGEFEIFSYENLGQGNKSSEIEAKYVKDLRVVIRDGELLSDVVLVDDDISFTTHDQRPCLQTPFLWKWDFEEIRNCTADTFSDELRDFDHSNGDFAKNSIYYMLGIFKTYFEHEEYKKLPFREGLKQILPEFKLTYPRFQFGEFYDHYYKKHPFVRGMIDIGLSEVRKQVPDAKFYGKPPLSHLCFYQLLAYVASYIVVE